MNPARLTVARPIATIMATLITVTVGWISLGRLPIDLLPDVTYPTLTVATSYANAGPEEIEQLITRPIEEAVAAVPGVEQMTSVSSEGSSSVRVAFAWGTNLDVASNDVRDRVERVAPGLPDEAERPRVRKFDVGAFPILTLGVASRLDPIELRRLVDAQVTYRLERVPGVASIEVGGGLDREIQVELHEDRIQALGLSLDGIREAIRNANVNLPTGQIARGNLDATLRTPGEFTSLHELRETVVAVREGVPVRLRQIADVADSHARVTSLVRINGEPGIRLSISKQSGSNTVAVAQGVLREVEGIRRDFPQLTVLPVIDTSAYIQRSIDNVTRALLYGGVLAVLVLLFFLRDLRSTLVAAAAIPISVIATFALVYFGGFTLNLMTLGGLALGVGMMVDNAIVVLENIARLRERKGYDPAETATIGTGQVAAAIIASTITTLVIFLPVVFLEEMAGVLFRQLAYVVSFALICSLAVALTLVPMLAARLPATAPSEGRTSPGARLAAIAGGLFARLERGYAALLDRALRGPFITLGVVGALFGATVALIPFIGSEFMPAADEGEVRVTVEMERGTRVEVLDERVRRVEALVGPAVPEAVASVVRVGGGGYRSSPATGEISLTLVPAGERSRSSEQIAAELRDQLRGEPGVVIRTRAGRGLFLLRMGSGGGGDERLGIEVRGHELATLESLAAAVEEAIADVEGITDVRVSRRGGVEQQLLRIDRERAADLDVSVSQIARTLEGAISGSSAGLFREAGDEVRIRVRIADAERLDLEQILDLTTQNARGEQVVLRNLVRIEPGLGPVHIERKDQQRLVTVGANLGGRDLGAIVADVGERLQSVPRPRNYEMVITGDWEERQRAFAELMLSIVLALALVYMVLACLYESLLDPLIVMGAVPLAVIGVVAALLLTSTTFNVQTFIGCIMLVGIVVNNAILIVDQAGRLKSDEVMPAGAAIRTAAHRRLRPILMTSLTTMLALLPLALGVGEGSEAQAPLARAVIGGLLSATFITLLVIPVIYALVHGQGETVPGNEPEEAPEPVPALRG